jgi:hypothetical protein
MSDAGPQGLQTDRHRQQDYSSDDEDVVPNIEEQRTIIRSGEPVVNLVHDALPAHWDQLINQSHRPPLSSCGSVASADVTNTDYDEDAIDYITNHLRRHCEVGEGNGDDPSGFRICGSSADSAEESASDSADSVHDSDEQPSESEEEAERHINFAAQSEGDFQRYLASVRECADEDLLSADGLKRKFFRIRSKSSKATEKAANSYWQLFREFLPHFKLQSYLTVRNKMQRGVPMPTTDYTFIDIEKKEEFVIGDTKVFPRKQFGDTSKYEVVDEYSRTPLLNMFNFFLASHFDADEDIKMRNHKVTFSLDGVPIDKSSGRGMDIASVQFEGCKNVYIIAIHIYRHGRPKSLSNDLDTFVKEVKRIPQLTVKQIVADAPCRAHIKNVTGHSGRYSCESCYARGNDGTPIRWPASTMNSPHLRCNESVRTLALKMDNNEFSKQELLEGHNFGVKGSSPLMKLTNFDMIYQCQPDPMHNLWLGAGKHIIMRTLSFRSKDIAKILNAKKTTNKISTSKPVEKMMNAMNTHLLVTKMISEVPRQTRSIWHLLRYKASEWKSLIVILFVIIIDAFTDGGYNPHARVWAKYVYLCRLAMLPDELYQEFSDSELAGYHQEFYDDFERVFGINGCTFNIHAFSHTQQYRKRNYLSDVTTEPFEDNYRFVAGMYHSGTLSVSNQICRGMNFLRLYKHQCWKKMTLEVREDNVNRTSRKLANDLFYSCHQKFYRAIQSLPNNVFICREIMTSRFTRIERLNWDKVGVRVFEREGTVDVSINMSDMMCKAVICKHLIVAVFSEILLC